VSPGGVVVWFTGLPSSGKSTLAARVRTRLRAVSRPAVLLDGDEVRSALEPPPGHGEGAREAFYATLGKLAALLARQDLIVLVAATAHRRAFRERVRAAVPHFVEVHVATPAEVCACRDAKGLWAAARAGELEGLPGIGVTYEPPVDAEVVASGGEDATAEVEILAHLGVSTIV
jgi:adenylylsulfate kinase